MKGRMKKIASLLEKSVAALFAAMVAYLLTLTTFTTAALDTVEHTTLMAANPVEKVAVIAAGCGAALGLGWLFRQEKRRIKLTEGTEDRIHRALLTSLGIFAVLFILSAQKMPNADQFLVINTAAKWRNGDYSDFQPGGYLRLFPHQCGIVMIDYFLSFLVGQSNYLALQLMNALAQVFLAKNLGDLAAEATGRRQTRILVDLAFLAFLPLTIYGTFAYGNWPGLALSAAALAQAARLRRDGKKIRILWGALLLLGALCLSGIAQSVLTWRICFHRIKR